MNILKIKNTFLDYLYIYEYFILYDFCCSIYGFLDTESVTMPTRYGMEISHEKSKPLVNDSDPNKCNSKILTISMYGEQNKNKLSNRLNILW